jgi:hypothetical protein
LDTSAVRRIFRVFASNTVMCGELLLKMNTWAATALVADADGCDGAQAANTRAMSGAMRLTVVAAAWALLHEQYARAAFGLQHLRAGSATQPESPLMPFVRLVVGRSRLTAHYAPVA